MATLLQFLDMAWRTFATGICFAAFGLGQLVLGWTIFPLILILVRDPLTRRRLGKRVIHLAFKAHILLMRVTRVLDVKLKHLERLDRPGLLVLANHPTLIDAVFLISFLKQADCVIKSSLFENPYIRFAAKGAGYIANVEDSLAVVEACRSSFEEGNSLLVFPEATRSQPGAERNLRRGAAQIAIRTRRDITLVIIRVSEHNLGKESHWWKVPPKRVSFEFEVKEDLPIKPYLSGKREPAMAARDLTQHLAALIKKETA